MQSNQVTKCVVELIGQTRVEWNYIVAQVNSINTFLPFGICIHRRFMAVDVLNGKQLNHLKIQKQCVQEDIKNYLHTLTLNPQELIDFLKYFGMMAKAEVLQFLRTT